VLTTEVLGRSSVLTDLPVRKNVRGLGLSDWEGYAGLLDQRFDYINTYYDSDPKLDITAVPSGLDGRYDFVIASDVFEHVAPPIGRAFANARRLLKSDGVLVFSVPYTLEDETLEHFPELHKFEIEKDGAAYTLRNITVDGREQVFRNLIFHGGSGLTLEMRRFAKASLLREFRLAGFESVEIYGASDLEHGVFWTDQWSLPIAARPAR